MGAGPAGLVAAEALARAGARVEVFDHMPSPARKFLMAGRGGLNLTHSEPLDLFLTRYGAAARRLEPFIRAFSPQDLREWCAGLGEETFLGTSGRVFPKSFKASPLLRGLLARLAQQGVVFKPRHEFLGLGEGRTLSLRDAAGAAFDITPDAAVFALGGASWPRLGADGGWARAFAEAGVALTPLAPANCALHLAWSPHFLASFEGQPLKSLRVSHGEKAARGDLVVTRRGLEGGPAYALASALRESLARGATAILTIDLRPDQSIEALAEKVTRPRGKASLATHLRKTLALSKIDIALLREASPEGLPSEPQALAARVKAAPLTIAGVAGFERAISTAGGVAFEALDESLMLKARPGLFVAGEMLDFDAPTGGYLLQAAFSTGVAAGKGAARFLGLEA
ncbi:TIGR03862 family flavoprotein [Methylocystis bryophila]|uniref:TIGR03862 family flavoprotein n=1 Tax=Methylocystis bryophila TaxID=655015 RepID=UPI003EB82F06